MSVSSEPALAGVRILDASRVLAGPFCGQLLGDLGAEVIKVERPGSGDETRTWGPPFAGELSAYYLSCNRNKRAVTVDLARPEGLEIFYRLVKRADVLLENFRASSAQRLGLDREKLLKVNPRLIVCSISGFGRTGPMQDLPGYDFAIQALSGLMSITGPVAGPPCKVGVAVTDVLTGLYAGVAVLACLHARRQSGHGYGIDLALLDCAVASQVNVAQAFLTSGTVPARQGNAHLQIVPYQLFATADSWLVLAVGNDGQWQQFCTAAMRPDLADDPRFRTNSLRVQNRELLVPLVEEALRGRTTADWQAQLRQTGVPHAPVWDYATLFSQEQSAERGWKLSVHDPQGRAVDLLASPFHIAGMRSPESRMPPLPGQDNEEVFTELLGLGAADLERLRREGVI
jgi:crotonobetainyl-CoA:carnitine CoA-transferase CaiB-like acyl-CoA transferase